ncbi:ArgP/LysG family DNA-binding transcriptional regulator [Pseudarthrobacter sp. CC12]|uniref:ArgP/LysG family DNA-binding transcriptional regulator n=1 Tax=Pseudarthrobacter sp. CC12 TaxID=3029193 RepID=UPI003264F6C0
MNFEYLRALSAVVETGSFEAAARLVGVTASAVSQRIKALESSVGQVVVRRGPPATATAAGRVLLKMARQVQELEADTLEGLGQGPQRRAAASIAVDSYSLATWFSPVLADMADWADIELDLRITEQNSDRAGLLGKGDVLGAVSTHPNPIGGCRVERLGIMRYIPVAAPALIRRFSNGQGPDWQKMPMIRCTDDDLHDRVLGMRAVSDPPPTHTIPTPDSVLEAARAGLGWGLIPELQFYSTGKATGLARLEPPLYIDVELFWHCWSISSSRLERVSRAIRRASQQLHQS